MIVFNKGRDGREAEGTRLLSGYPGKNRDRGFESLSLRHPFSPRRAVIPAAGRGRRLLPLTQNFPKELLPVKGHPMIYYALREAALCGVEEIIVIVNPKKRTLIEYLEEEWREELGEEGIRPPRLRLLEQPLPRGSGDALWRAREFLREGPFLWMMPDFVLLGGPPPALQILRALNPLEAKSAVGVIRIEPGQGRLFGNVGIVRGEWKGKRVLSIRGLSGKRAEPLEPNRPLLKAIGRWLLLPSIFPLLVKHRQLGPEWDDTPALQALCEKEEVVGVLLEGRGFDVGNILGYQAANSAY